mmetsp:Transcript_17356/g.31290  ORF Transcript_17356/g.31290 Transcript_17356/m.31290 type:complete len:136 (-) Transcript_17356:7774-8181(-)
MISLNAKGLPLRDLSVNHGRRRYVKHKNISSFVLGGEIPLPHLKIASDKVRLETEIIAKEAQISKLRRKLELKVSNYSPKPKVVSFSPEPNRLLSQSVDMKQTRSFLPLLPQHKTRVYTRRSPKLIVTDPISFRF